MLPVFYGNEFPQKLLSAIASGNRLHHAYLVLGESGLGKKTFAQRLAMSVLCKGENKPCMECSACKKVLNGTHPDVKVYFNTEKRNYPKDTIREICTDSYVMPNESQYKIYIINNAETISTDGFNVFLKTLEEPPKGTIFVLNCQNKANVPATVISRMIRINLSPVSFRDCVLGIKQAVGSEFDQMQIEEAASISGGNIGKGIAFLNKEQSTENSKLAGDFLQAFADKNEFEALCVMSKVEGDTALLTAFCSELIVILRDAAAVNCKGMPIGENKAVAENFAKVFTIPKILDIISLINQFLQIINSNINAKLRGSLLVSQISLIAW